MKKEKCKEKVWSGWRFRRCSHNAVKAGYCKQHHPDSVKARQEKSDARWEAKMESSPLSKAMRKIAELEAEIERLKAK